MRIFLLLLLAWPLHAATITADSTSIAHIEAAISAASNGDTVLVPAGTNSNVNADITIGKRITIAGAGTNVNSRTLLINTQTRGFVGDESPIFTITSDNVTVSNFWFRGDAANLDNDGAHVSTEGVQFSKCVFESFAWGQKWYGISGLVYWSYFLNNDIAARLTGFPEFSDVQALGEGNPPWGWTSTNYIVFEDCVFQQQSWPDDTYIMDTEYACNYMVRHCTGLINRTSGVTLDGFDMHNSNERVPLGMIIYSNTWTFSGASTVDCKWTDIRGGANSLVWGNTIVSEDAYASMRDDIPTGQYMTNTFFWANVEKDGAFDAGGSTPPTEDTHFFNNAPGGFDVVEDVLQYPHPLRSEGGEPDPPPTRTVAFTTSTITNLVITGP